jgi:cellulose synthase/poly-beta-1,6-N-acetylglucosamine synthase-like glycosyltransferase
MDVTPILLIFMGFCSLYGVLVYTASLYRGKKLKIRKDYSYTPKVSVMLAAFNEGRAVYDTIAALKRANYPSHLIEIIAFNDCSKDDTWTWLLKAEAEFEGVRVFNNPYNMGKSPTLAKAAGQTTGEIILCTDADTIFDPAAIRELVCCLADPSVGGVGGTIGIVNVNDSLLTQMQSVLYGVAYWLFKPMENLNGAVQCLSGPLVAFRRELYLDIVPEILDRNFLGEPVYYGEDRFITQNILLRGWKTYTNLDAKCWVGTPHSWGNFLKQQLRWKRGAINRFLNTLANTIDYNKKAGVLPTIYAAIPVMTNMAWLLLIFWMILAGTILQSLIWLFVAVLILMPLKVALFNHIFKTIDRSQVVNNPILCAFFFPVWFAVNIFVVTPWALLTLDDGGWVTRQNGLTGNA